MIKVDTYSEILEILLRNVGDETCGHVSFVSDADTITDLLREVNLFTNAEPDLINFDNSGDDFYVFEFDYYDVDNYLSYSIWPAQDEDGIFNTNYGLCLVDKVVPKNFEKDYAEYGAKDKDYIKPIRVSFSFKDTEDKSKEEKKPILNSAESTKIDKNDDGSVSGFTKSWKNNNSHFTYSFHSTDEKSVLELMEKLGVKA